MYKFTYKRKSYQEKVVDITIFEQDLATANEKAIEIFYINKDKADYSDYKYFTLISIEEVCNEK